MARTSELQAASRPLPLKISRTFPAPRELVFNAWNADHIKRWFAPKVCTIPEAQVEMRIGGTFALRMCGPGGIDHRMSGKFVEVTPYDRLVFDVGVSDATDRLLFRAYTEVDFHEVPEGTRMDVTQTYTFASSAEAARAIGGASQGWSETLDKLETELLHMKSDESVKRSVTHATFSIERTYDAPVARVFAAFSDMTAKSKWFAGAEGRWQPIERQMDFRVGGRERLSGRWEGGVVSTFDAVYYDIVPDARIVYGYTMHLDDRKISVSLTTLELKPAGAGRTTLKITEQGAFLDNYDDVGARQHGTGLLLDRLGVSLGG